MQAEGSNSHQGDGYEGQPFCVLLARNLQRLRCKGVGRKVEHKLGLPCRCKVCCLMPVL